MTRRRVAALCVLVALAIAAAAVTQSLGRGAAARRVARPSSLLAGFELPGGPRPAFTPAAPRLLRRTAATRVAAVVRDVPARREPWPGATVATSLRRLTPEGTQDVVVVEGEAYHSGTLWVRVALPVLPNGTTGWVPRTSLGGYTFVDTELVVDRARLTATLYRGGRRVFAAPVGVGVQASPTPRGRFYVRERLTSLSAFYGPIAFGTNARSPVLTDWPGGGFIGIHGTDEPQLIPGRISHGCIRLRNRDIERLARLLPVGTPVIVL
jgi:L,D-transpeptidase catalytic domain